MRKCILLAVSILAAACGSDPLSFDTGQPPDLVVTAGDQAVVLAPFSYCWSSFASGVCADGEPQEPLPVLTLSEGESLSMEYPLDWDLTMDMTWGDGCEGGHRIDVDPDGAPIDALGAAQVSKVVVFGQGDRGDGAFSFELLIETDRAAPPALASVGWHPSGRAMDPDAPFTVTIHNVDERPDTVVGTARVRAGNGAVRDVALSAFPIGECWQSTAGFEGSDEFTRRALESGPAPYEVIVTVSIDGEEVVLPAIRWPDDFPEDSNILELIRIEP